MAPSLFAVVGPSPLAGTLLRVSALGSLAIAASKLALASRLVSGLADQPLSDATVPAKENKLSFYSNATWFVIGGLLQLKWSYSGIPSVLDKAAFVLVALNYAAGGLGNYRIGLTGPAFAFAGSLVPMLASLSD